MREVSGPIIAIALVLCAVFVPMAFLSGVTGQFFRQFAVTIAISTVISAFNSLTLSPALAARAAQAARCHAGSADARDRPAVRLVVSAVEPRASSAAPIAIGVHRRATLARRAAVFARVRRAARGAVFMFKRVPGGFIPTQDKMY